ncbi:MAG: hypothetical protein ACRDMJ_05940, partial [Solirubrobacteraceae bacterium]
AEVERLAAELAAATRALELERERRTSLDHALDDERATTRQLRTELGQAQADLELARAQQTQALAAEHELDGARRELIETQRRHEELVREHERAAKAHAATLTELHEGLGALESAPATPGEDGAGRRDQHGASHDEHDAPRPLRPVNPSLRHRTYWLGRFLALLMLGVVVAAIWVLIHSTIVH